MCEDGAAVVRGEDGRWHRLEECDDGNAADGDGCVRRARALWPVVESDRWSNLTGGRIWPVVKSDRWSNLAGGQI